MEIWENIFKICAKLGFHPKEIVKCRFLNKALKEEIDKLYEIDNPVRRQRIEYETQKLKSEMDNVYNSSIGKTLLHVEEEIEKILYDKKFVSLRIHGCFDASLRALKCLLLKRNVEYLNLKINFRDQFSNINLSDEANPIFFREFGLFLKKNKNLTHIKRLKINNCKINAPDLQEILPNLTGIEINSIELENSHIENNGCEILIEYLPNLDIQLLELDCSHISEDMLVELFKSLSKSIKTIYLHQATLNHTQNANIVCDAIKKSNVKKLEFFRFSATKDVKEKMRKLQADTSNSNKFVEVIF